MKPRTIVVLVGKVCGQGGCALNSGTVAALQAQAVYLYACAVGGKTAFCVGNTCAVVAGKGKRVDAPCDVAALVGEVAALQVYVACRKTAIGYGCCLLGGAIERAPALQRQKPASPGCFPADGNW